MPAELRTLEGKLRKIREAKAALEAEALERTGDPDAVPDPKAQRNFTDPESRIMLSKPEGWIYGYNAQAVVDEAHQVSVATELTTDATDSRSLPGLTDQVEANTGRRPKRLLADAGYQSDENLAALDSRGIDAYVAVRREHHSAPPAPAPRGRIPKGLSRRERMARKLRTKAGRAHYARRKVIVEPRLRPDQGARRLPAVPPAGQTEGERRVAAGVCRPQPGQALPERPRWAGHPGLGPIGGPGRWQRGPRMGLMGTGGAPSDPSTRPAACYRPRPARGAPCARESAPGIAPHRRRARAISNAAS